MADHSKFLALARRLIAKEGRSVTFGKLATTSADAARPWKGPARTAGLSPPLTNEVTTIAVFLPGGGGFSGYSDFGKLITDNDLFKNAEQLLLVAPPASGGDLSGYNVVVDGSVRWKIDAIKELKPADLTVLFAMAVNR